MEITRNQVITIVLFLMMVCVYYTWDYKSESFSVTQEWPFLPPRQWKNKPFKKWGEQWYYPNETQMYPAVPSIVNYSDTQYKLPEEAISLNNLENEFNDKQQIPVAHNIHSGQTNQVAGTENINQIGAFLDDVLEQEDNIMQPMQEMKHKTQRYATVSPFPEVRASVRPELSHEAILQELQFDQESNDEGSLIHELTDTQPITTNEYLVQRSLMSGMEQKHLMEERTEESEHNNYYGYPEQKHPEQKQAEREEQTEPIIVKVKKTDYSLSLAILLVVLLIGFIYYTRD